jgi:5-dehydro-2-deoxygluconokinase
VAVAAARYGRRSAVITRTGQDPFGEYLHDALRGFGVDDRYVTAVPGLPTLGWKISGQAPGTIVAIAA